jgi:pimeloyl-ACP methyl ester carboxylesterase
MAETIGLTTGSGLTFTADVAGPPGGPLVLLLHGFPESRHSWRAALPEIARAGYRCVAPDQRGYSPGARPDPADLSNYAFGRLVNDALEIAAAAGYEGRRFHQVGHDWGGQVAWGVADAHPGSPRSRSCRGRIRCRSAARCRTRTATRSTARAITPASSSPRPARC